KVTLTFDRAVFADGGLAATLVSLDAPAVASVVTSWSINGSSATIKVSPDLSPRARYTIIVAGIVDLNDEPVSPPTDRVDFAPAPRRARRSFDLWEMLPQHVRASDDSGELALFVACLQDVVDLLLAD